MQGNFPEKQKGKKAKLANTKNYYGKNVSSIQEIEDSIIKKHHLLKYMKIWNYLEKK